ncbi:MAG: cytochrome b/b6 domain-containing protein, partial [Novosphingobium sp.]
MSETPATARIWDPAIRLFHWLLVGFVGFSWWTGEQHDMEWHRLSGYAILALLVFRLFWGFAGPHTARFGQFVKGPGAVLAYAKTLGSKQAHAADGHNPLGGWSTLALIGVLLV